MSINKSKPVYTPLSADIGGRFHLMLGCGDGAVTLRRVIDELRAAAPDALGRTRVLLGNSGDPLQGLGLTAVHSFETTAALLADFQATLERSLMGTRLYVAGPEHFIGRALQIALAFNLNKDEIRAEPSGTLARRVHCVHCRTTAEEVRTNIVRCSGCSRWLAVRDHYSRRLAAYMGVMADAEAAGDLPPVQEIYP